jgi:hypothetical protein
MAVPIAMTQEQHALQASLRDWAKRAEPLALVRALEQATEADSAALLADLDGLGVFANPLGARCLRVMICSATVRICTAS